ncbi:MAG TPA: hypothetical protein VKI64_01010 [Acidimicrobiales bacterium]|nr:hypothetical protein [Acidimicrobiales bacterium]
MVIRTTIRKAVAGILTAGVMLASGGMAYADTSTPPQAGSTPNAAVKRHDGSRCRRAEGRLDALNRRRAALEARIDKLQKRIARARAHHREDVAERLEKRVDALQKAKERVSDRIQRIHERCDQGSAGAPGAATPAAAQ